MKKVAFLSRETKKSGGLEKYARHLIEAFTKSGQQVTLLSHENPLFKKRGLLCHQKLKNFDSDCNLWLKKNPHDIVFGLDRNSYQTHYRAGNGVHKSYLELRKREESLLKSLSFRINPLHQSILKLEKQAFENPSLKRLFTNSHFVKRQILEEYNIDEKKVTVVHNGVEWENFEKPFQERIDSPYPHLLFAGHGYKRKGLVPLLKALSLIKSEWKLTIVGKEPSIAAFEKIAKDLSLSSKVEFVGAVPTLTPYLQRATIQVIPSIYDPFANVTLEALAMGLFVVSSPFNGGHEILEPSIGATLADIDPQTIASALMQAMDSSHDKEKIRQKIKPYTFSKQLETIVNITLKDAS